MSADLELFHHIHHDHKSDTTLFLLHGTGGDEHDLLNLIQPVRSQYNLVGLRGNVSEHGMNRFFHRHQPGIFDQQNIKQETTKLARFITAWQQQYPTKKTIFLGYSNGANMILATLFLYPELVPQAILLHPMLPFENIDNALDLHNHSFMVTYGTDDQMIPATESLKVINTLESLHATVKQFEYPGGHQISQPEMKDITQYLLQV